LRTVVLVTFPLLGLIFFFKRAGFSSSYTFLLQGKALPAFSLLPIRPPRSERVHPSPGGAGLREYPPCVRVKSFSLRLFLAYFSHFPSDCLSDFSLTIRSLQEVYFLEDRPVCFLFSKLFSNFFLSCFSPPFRRCIAVAHTCHRTLLFPEILSLSQSLRSKAVPRGHLQLSPSGLPFSEFPPI